MLTPARSPKLCLCLRLFQPTNFFLSAILFTFCSLHYLSGQTSGLVAAYNFNEGSGSTVTDLSGHNLNGTIVGATWTTQGKYGAALSFNGTSSYVDLGNPAALQLTGSITLEAWVKAAATPPDDGQIVAKSNDSSGWQLKTTRDAGPQNFNVTVTNSSGTRAKRFSTTTRALNTWYHVAGVYDASARTLTTYVNGVLESGILQGTVPIANLNAAVNANIGRRTGGYYFNGIIDEVRIYNRALSATEIQNDMNTPFGGSAIPADTQAPTAPANLNATSTGTATINLNWTAATDNVGVTGYQVERCQGIGCSTFAQIGTSTNTTYGDSGLSASTSYGYRVRAIDAAGKLGPYSNIGSATTTAATTSSGLVAAYSFNEGAGTTVTDSSGNGVSGTLQGASWTTAGKYGNALSFNGTNSFVDLGNPSALQLTESMTVEAWVKAAAEPSDDGQIVAKANESGGWQLKTSPDTGGRTFGAKISGSSSAQKYSNTVPALNTWYHVASVYNASTRSLDVYVNGVLDSGTLRGTVPTTQILQNVNVNIGRRTGGYYFNGIIDEVRIYNRALSATEIQNDRNTPIGSSSTPVDTQAPSTPGSLSATAVSSTQVNLSWTAPTDNVGVTGYRVERCSGAGCTNFVQIATPTTATYSNTGLTAGTSYSYRVRATDAAGNLSSYSTAATATTSAAAPTAPSITQQPANKAVSVGQTATFTVVANGTAPLSYQWQKGTTNIQNAISSSYTTPATTSADNGSQFRVVVTNAGGSVTSSSATLTVTASAAAVDVLTYHNDIARTGANTNETMLTTSNVATATFGKIGNFAVDAKVDAQPLYASNVSTSSGTHNLLIVVTENNTVYAFDANSGTIVWQKSMSQTGETASDDRGCSQVSPKMGITSTPVIDRSRGPNGAIYLVAMSKNGSTYHQRFHALDLATGGELFNGPKEITAQYPGTGDASNGANVIFDPSQYKERMGLLLMNGTIYTAWASHCDFTPYTGWVMAHSADTLATTAVLNIVPNGSMGAFWSSGGGIAADPQGNIYLLVGNGDFGTTLNASGFPANGNYGNAAIKLSTAGGGLAVADYFEMSNGVSESAADTDFGSGGAMVLPDFTDSTGQTRHLVLGAGKDANIYVLNRDNMGKFNSSTNNIYQQLSGVLGGGIFSVPAYFNNRVYYGPVGNFLKAYTVSNARLTSSSAQTSNSFGYPGTSPSVSANGTSNGIVWAVENSGAVLHAYDATTLNELYNSNQAANNRDNFGAGNKFITPTIVNGKVFVGTQNSVAVFGLLP